MQYGGWGKALTLEETSLASVLDKMQYICQNDEGEAHAEVIDQSINSTISFLKEDYVVFPII